MWAVKIGSSLENSFIDKLSTQPNDNDYVEILRRDKEKLKNSMLRTK